MNPQWISAGVGLLQVVGLAVLWRTQRDLARLVNDLKEWVHRGYMPRELADERYVHRQDSAGFSAVSKQVRANS